MASSRGRTVFSRRWTRRASTPRRFVPGPNFYFLTGANFHLMERPTAPRRHPRGAAPCHRAASRAHPLAGVAPDVETIYWQDSDGYDDAFAALAGRVAPARIGVEGQRMRVFEAEALRAAFPARRCRRACGASRGCGCTRTRARSRRCGGRSRSARRRWRDARRGRAGMSETEFRAPPRGGDAGRAAPTGLVRPDRARRRRFGRPARRPSAERRLERASRC